MNVKKVSFFAQKNILVLVSLLGVYLLSTGISWAVFSLAKGGPEKTAKDVSDSRSRIDPNLPKTEECPINGKMFSKPERDIWEKRRPITAVIENHADSRPQSGLSYADVVYEAVAEGGITRFLSVFYCGASAMDVRIAPIRSARVYLIEWAAEYGKSPIFVHIGGANNICNQCPGGVKTRGQVAKEVDAYALLDKLGWWGRDLNDFNGETNIGYPVIQRDQYRLGDKAAWEHSVVGFTDKMFDEAEKRGFGYKDSEGDAWNEAFQGWKFMEGKPAASVEGGKISFSFWDNKGDYDVTWEYDKSSNSYKRINGGNPHTDHETKQQIAVSNVVIMFVEERGPVDKEGHMFYTTTGRGDALFFQNGEVVEGKWEKESTKARTEFADSQGKGIPFVKGQIWIEAVPKGNDIDY